MTSTELMAHKGPYSQQAIDGKDRTGQAYGWAATLRKTHKHFRDEVWMQAVHISGTTR